MLDNYVQNGGKLIATGGTSAVENGTTSSIRLKSLGVEPQCEIFPQSQATYLKVSNGDKEALGVTYFNDFTLMMMNSKFLKCKIKENAQGYLRFLPTNMYGPAEKTYYSESEITEFPGAVAYTYGQGKTIFIPWMIGTEYNTKGNYAQRNLFLASLKNILNVESSIETDASASIEMTHLANLNGAFEWVGLINHTGFLGNSVREPVNIHNTNVRVKTLKPVKDVWLVRSGEKIDYKQNDGWIECNIPVIKDFEMLLCTY
jgi:hypothetical protein